MKPPAGGDSKYGDRVRSSGNKHGDGTFVQNKYVGRGGNRSATSSRVHQTSSILTPSELLHGPNVVSATRNKSIVNEDIHAQEKEAVKNLSDGTFVQNKHVRRGGSKRSIASTRVQPTVSIPTPSELLQRPDVENTTRNMSIENEDIHTQAEGIHGIQDDHVESSPSYDLHNTKGAQKKTRGVTRCLDLLSMDRRKLLVVDVNDLGQPVGPNARKLASYLGTIARNPQKAPLTWDDWRKMPGEYKNHMWDLVKEKFEVDDALYIWVMKSLGNKWKNFKCSLKKIYLDAVMAGEDVLNISDPRVDPTQWKELLNFWRSEKSQERSAVNKLNRDKQIVGHTTGSKSFAMIREEIRQKKDDVRNPSRAELFSITHTRKDGRPVNAESARVMVQEDNASPSAFSSASSHDIQQFIANRISIQGHRDNFSKRNTQLHSEVQQGSKKRGRNDANLNAQGKIVVYLKSFKKSLVNVALATVQSKDPLKKVGGCDLGHEYWEVAINVALIHNEPLPRPYGQFKTIGDAIGATIAWPFTLVTRVEE